MNEDNLELLITLDDPEVAQDEDTFDHLRDENTLEYCSVSRFRPGDSTTDEQKPLLMTTPTR